MKEKIRKWICSYVKDYEKQEGIETRWGEPLVGFADAAHPYIQQLKEVIAPSHELPADVIKDAATVIVYYVPFTRGLAETNRTGTEYASAEWARAYEETNQMFRKLNDDLIQYLAVYGWHAGISPKTSTFDQERLESDWSYRHFAYAAGLGTFGLNNMLITKRGCCGRYNTLVTNLQVIPDQPVSGEYCLYKKNGSCAVCVRNCPAGALTKDGYDRHLCYGLLMKNAQIHTGYGTSYLNECGTASNSAGSDVCGKCVTQSPCAFWNIE